MVVVDSSGWIEFFTDGPKADAYARYLKDLQSVATPAVVVYEVYKKIRRERGEEMAKLCVAQMQKTSGIAIDQDLALRAADLSLKFSLAMADSLVLATARALGAELITGGRLSHWEVVRDIRLMGGNRGFKSRDRKVQTVIVGDWASVHASHRD